MVGHEPAIAFRDARVCAAPENDAIRDSALVTSAESCMPVIPGG
jgi:hypothetical protein